MSKKPKTSEAGRVSLAISQNDAKFVSATLAAAVIAALGDKVLSDKRGPAAAAVNVYHDVLSAIKPVIGEAGDKYTLQTRDPSRARQRS